MPEPNKSDLVSKNSRDVFIPKANQIVLSIIIILSNFVMEDKSQPFGLNSCVESAIATP